MIQEIAALQRPAVGGRRAPDRPGRVRRPPARPPRARPGGAPAHVHARGDRRVPRPPVGGRPRRRVPRRQPRLAARRRRAGRGVRPLPLDLAPTAATSPRRRSRRRRSSRSATPTSRTCGCPTARRSTRATPRQRAALTVYSTLLGGSMGSRLFDEIREQRGLAYSVYSVDHTFADVPILQLSAGPGVGQVRRGLHAHARDRRRAARATARRRRSSSAPAPTPPAAACWRSRTRTPSRATRPPRRSSSARTSTPTPRSRALDETTLDEVAEVARGVSEELSVACVGPHSTDEFARRWPFGPCAGVPERQSASESRTSLHRHITRR